MVAGGHHRGNMAGLVTGLKDGAPCRSNRMIYHRLCLLNSTKQNGACGTRAGTHWCRTTSMWSKIDAIEADNGSATIG